MTMRRERQLNGNDEVMGKEGRNMKKGDESPNKSSVLRCLKMDDSFEEMRQRRKYRESESSRQGDNESNALDRDDLIWNKGDRIGYAASTSGVDAETDDLERRKRRLRSRKELERVHFQMVNDRVVDDITMDVLYKPHTLTILAILCVVLLYLAFVRYDSATTENNVYDGLMGTLVLFLVVSALAFPNGPFIRPHPLLWRIVFGLSVVYLMILQFTLFQTYEDIKKVLTWLDPKGLSHTQLEEKEYAQNCSDVTLERIWSYCDIFAIGHFTGWAMKALLIRHSVICWYISIMWELTEIVFSHLLPNFAECWWDAIIMDVLLCNGLGIWFGMKVCEFLEMRTFHWESIKDIPTRRGRFKRAVMQLTPESWAKTDWFNVSNVFKRTISIFLFVLIWIISELNTFFMKHVFSVDTRHPVVFWRLILIAWISAPSIRQYYLYATDPLVKRLGMQCWVYCAVCALEAAICIKFGKSMFPAVAKTNIALWLALLVVGTFIAIWISVKWAEYSSETEEVKVAGENRMYYLDSSHENLGAIADDVKRRRRSLGISESDLQ
ncbi:hypothetical protein WR25_25442 [Diploscapter pachys]|uniref:Phosphatidylserine synthase n=1 Tax=Diploscapter pachys TaxID=2018661 RepID=A0A2A2J2Z0_9BILA|nr:hypothetical protein WR25_25442 [Diploscapter pachys]